MKIIEQSHKFIKESNSLKLIELCGRTCYKSSDKITEDSAGKFVRMIAKRGHYSVIEHAGVCFEVTDDAYLFIQLAGNNKHINRTSEGRLLVSGNFRAWYDFILRCHEVSDENSIPIGIWCIARYLHETYPDIFPATIDLLTSRVHVVPEASMTHEEKLIHVTRTCRFITNRGVSHELVIKRNNWSFSQESTRYVRYNGDMKFIKPVWWKEDPETDADVNAQHFWRSHMFDSEKRYGYLLNEGWRSEQARDILPLSLASEIVCTAPLKEWWHMLGLRTSKAAHPQIRALMQPVLAELEKELPFF